jgi:hypothetical protein
VAVHIYTQTIHSTTQTIHSTTQKNGRVRAVPRLCGFYPDVCLTTAEKARKNLSQVKKNLSHSTKTSVTVQYTYYQKHPHITKPSQTHTLQNSHTQTHTHTTKQYKYTTAQIKTKCKR